MTEQDVYKFYNEKVKIIYSEIEARNNVLPIELLFEIHSAFDHLKRIHVDGESAEEQAGKAYSHLKRGCLDAFKLKLKFFNDDQKKVYDKKADLRIIDNGTFLTDFISERKYTQFLRISSIFLKPGKICPCTVPRSFRFSAADQSILPRCSHLESPAILLLFL